MSLKVFLFGVTFICGLFVVESWWLAISGVLVVVWWGRRKAQLCFEPSPSSLGLFFRSVFSWCIIGFLVGVLRFWVSGVIVEGDVRLLNGIEGVREFIVCVSEEVDVRSDKIKYIVSSYGGEAGGFGGKVLINASRYPVYEYGDVLKIRGEFKEPEMIDDFDYGKYLSRYGVYSVVDRASISKVGDGCGSKFFEWIYWFKDIVARRINEVFPEPYASLEAGLLLGSRKGIPQDLTDAFNKVGVSHIVAISGYNITLVIAVVFGMFGFLGRKTRAIVASVFVVLFVVLVGMGSSVVRAGIMGVVTMIGLYFGRRSLAINSILISAVLMNLWNPRIAVYDVGFQLSFLATLGLLYVSPYFERWKFWRRVPALFMIRENLALTLSAQTFALPVILKSFGRISVLCPIVNILILPFVPFAMLLGFLALVFGDVFAFPCCIVLDIIFFVVKVAAGLSP